jgi:hypothetical protein
MESKPLIATVLPFKQRVKIADPVATELEMTLLIDWSVLRRQKRWLAGKSGVEPSGLFDLLESIQYFAAGAQAAPPEVIFDEGDGGPAGVEGNPPNQQDEPT